MPEELFPGQVLVAEMTIDHLACLVSPARIEVFWNVSGEFPRSIAEIAAMLGRSASSVTYHMAELAKVGLVIPAGERKKRSRTETLYVLGSRRGFMTRSADAPADYRALALESVSGIIRMAIRERTELMKSYDVSGELQDFASVRRLSTKASRERAKSFRDRIVQEIREFAYAPPDEDGVHISLMFMMHPTLSESKKVSGSTRPRGKRVPKPKPGT